LNRLNKRFRGIRGKGFERGDPEHPDRLCGVSLDSRAFPMSRISKRTPLAGHPFHHRTHPCRPGFAHSCGRMDQAALAAQVCFPCMELKRKGGGAPPALGFEPRQDAVPWACIVIWESSAMHPYFSTQLCSLPANLQQPPQGFHRIRILDPLVGPPAQDSWEAHRHSGLVPGGLLDPLKGDLKNQFRLHGSDRPEFFQGVSFDEAIHLTDFPVAQAGVGLGKGNQGVMIPHGKGVIRVKARRGRGNKIQGDLNRREIKAFRARTG
jgi:hypothetical protein